MQRKHRSLVVIAAVAVIAASCSGGSDQTDGTTVANPEGSVDPAPTGSVVPPATDGDDGATADTQLAEEIDEPADEPSESEPRYMSGDSDYLFDQQQLHSFEINLPEEALAELDAAPSAEEYVEGSLTFDGETIGPIGVRYKGSVGAFVFCTESPSPLDPSGQKICTKLSMKLKINWDDPDAEFYGVRRVQLHSQNLDATKMHERLGYWLFREMGVPAPRSTHARVVVNGEYLGVFALTEQIDGRFTREYFADGTGNLYKEVWPFDDEGQPRGGDEFLGGLRTNEDENPSTDIITTFAEELASAGPEDALDVIERWADVDALLRAFVVDRAIGNDDGALHWYCGGISRVGDERCNPHNFYWYEDPSARQVRLIPWDLDNAFETLAPGGFAGAAVIGIADAWGEMSNDCEAFAFGPLGLEQRSAACDPLIGALGALDAEFDAIRAELVAGPFSAERVGEKLAEWTAQIETSVAEEAALHDDAGPATEWLAAVDALSASLDDARSTPGR